MSKIPVASIRLDGGTQPRATIHKDWIEEYASDMATGAMFPPVVVFFDGNEYWLADGFHRTGAAQALGLIEIEADVRQGTQRDAILFSVSANANHGQRRTNEDKRRAVLRLINDREWSGWSDREIARRCGVNHETVGKLRPAPPRPALMPDTGGNRQYENPHPDRVVELDHDQKPRTFTHPKTGKPTTMNTANIGRKPASQVTTEAKEPPPIQAAPPAQPRFEVIEEPAPSPPPSPVFRFDHDAAAVREKAMNAIIALANQPSPEVVIEAWMKHSGYGEEVETIERAIAWLTAFLPLYADVEPRRWAAIQERIRNVA